MQIWERRAAHKFRGKAPSRTTEELKRGAEKVIYVVHQDFIYKGFLMAPLDISNLTKE